MPRKKSGLAREAPVRAGKRSSARTIAAVVPPTTPSGRPSRKCNTVTSYSPLPIRGLRRTQAKNPEAEEANASSTPKPRGRPAKAVTDTPALSSKAAHTEGVKRGRGRPKKSDAATSAPAPAVKSTKRKRSDDEPASPEQPSAKRRGRPPKDATSTAAPKPGKQHAVKVPSDAKSKKAAPKTKKTTKQPDAEPKTRKPRGPNKPKVKAEGAEDSIAEHEKNEGIQYWLMKAEPDTRIVNNMDVSFPIDKLAAATEPEPWDGVRNPVARNNMRAMRKGDLAFFYHSNCSVPAVVGAMRIVEEHAPDESAFNPNHPYFDQRSKREKPTWDCVKVEFVKKFETPVTLKALKADPQLANMQISQKAYSRLSVQAVTPAQWSYVLKMAGEPDDVGVVPTTSGYEADTNGETDKEAGEDSVGIDDVDAMKMAAYGNPDEPIDEDEDGPAVHGDADVAVEQVNGIGGVHNSAVKLSPGDDGDDSTDFSSED